MCRVAQWHLRRSDACLSVAGVVRVCACLFVCVCLCDCVRRVIRRQVAVEGWYPIRASEDEAHHQDDDREQVVE